VAQLSIRTKSEMEHQPNLPERSNEPVGPQSACHVVVGETDRILGERESESGSPKTPASLTDHAEPIPKFDDRKDLCGSESPTTSSSPKNGHPVPEINPLSAHAFQSPVPPPLAGDPLDGPLTSESSVQAVQASDPQSLVEPGDSLPAESDGGPPSGDIASDKSEVVSKQQTAKKSGPDPTPASKAPSSKAPSSKASSPKAPTPRASPHGAQRNQAPKTWHELDGPLKVHQSVLWIFSIVLVLLTFTTIYVLAFSVLPDALYDIMPPSGYTGSLFLIQAFNQATQAFILLYNSKLLEAIFWARVSSERGTTLSSMLAISPGTDILGLWDLYGLRWHSEGNGRSNSKHSSSWKYLIPLYFEKVAKLLWLPFHCIWALVSGVQQPYISTEIL
jgi:hypothetical protein